MRCLCSRNAKTQIADWLPRNSLRFLSNGQQVNANSSETFHYFYRDRLGFVLNRSPVDFHQVLVDRIENPVYITNNHTAEWLCGSGKECDVGFARVEVVDRKCTDG